MQKLSDDDLLLLSDQDLLVVDLSVDLYSVEAKLSSGLYVYFSGHKDEVYSGKRFLFAGYVENLLVTKASPSEIGFNSDFNSDYIDYCSQDKSQEVYSKLEQIAKSIVAFSNGRILFYELGACEPEKTGADNGLSDFLGKYKHLVDKAIFDTNREFESKEDEHETK